MPLKLLAAADLHLGRRPGRLPEALTRQIPVRELGPAAAWRRTVELALEEEVHALLLAGDVVEAEHDFFEAYRELHDGVVELLEAGVLVLAVAGNHDTRVLPRLAGELEGFGLLGAEGEWESVVLSHNGDEATVWGWSFPRRTVRDSPLSGQRFERGPGPNLGLLHCDLGRAGSPYAPVGSQELEAADLDGWLLGHVHRPDALSAPRPVGYLGSLTGLDAGEPGPRGPWFLTFEGGGIDEISHAPLAPLRWIRLEVELDGIDAPEDARERLLARLREVDEPPDDDRPGLRALGVRVVFTGRTRYRDEVADLLSREDLDEIPVGDGSVHYFVETHRIETLPEVDLEELATQRDPVGLLARRLLLLERPPEDPDRRDFVARARGPLRRAARETTRERLEENPPDDAETADWLRRAGREALHRLLMQREEA